MKGERKDQRMRCELIHVAVPQHRDDFRVYASNSASFGCCAIQPTQHQSRKEKCRVRGDTRTMGAVEQHKQSQAHKNGTTADTPHAMSMKN